jgi:flagellin-like hook-associated protein FlgL
MADVTLTAALRANLLSLQGTQNLLNQTQLRLSTGLKVNSALDNPSSFFAASSLNNRASDLTNLLDGQAQAIQTIQAGNDGLTAITSYLQQALAIAKGALATANANGGSNVNATTDNASYNTLTAAGTGQIDQTATDSQYQGTSLIASAGVGGASLTVQFNESNTSSLTVNASDNTSTGLSVAGLTLGAGANTDAVTIQATITAINTAISTVRTNATALGNNLSVIQTRQDFTQNLVNTLKAGADQLTVADKNEEGAKLLSLQTTQSLGITSLSLASQANQSILRLFQ